MNKYAKDPQELRRICANLTFAKQLGLIDDDSLAAAEERCRLENARRGEKLAAGKVVYGLTAYPLPAYLQYELTRFRLEFALPSRTVRDSGYCPEITEAQKRTFYQENQDLLTRAQGDLFSYEEIEAVIEKRLREAAYDRLVQDILCQSETRE